MIKDVLDFLKMLNSDYSQLFLVLLALISFSVAYKEFVSNRRPYVVPEILVEYGKTGEWYFNVVLVNKGERPGIGRIDKALLKIGDESYPTPFTQALILAPNERQKISPIGHINETGRKKIKGHEYVDNVVTITLDIASRAIEDKEFVYKTHEVYKIDVSGDVPVITLIEENLI